jgi:hypothetical protein
MAQNGSLPLSRLLSPGAALHLMMIHDEKNIVLPLLVWAALAEEALE